MHVSNIHYLESKISVDDRARNPQVWWQLQSALNVFSENLRCLEIGVGTGALGQRVLQLDAARNAAYLGIDIASDVLPVAAARLDAEVSAKDMLPAEGQRRVLQADALQWLVHHDEPWDLICAQAWIDLVDIPQTLELLHTRLREGGLLYLPITYAGETSFTPVQDDALEMKVNEAYHRSMRYTGIDASPTPSKAALQALPASGFEVIASGASDWKVSPLANGSYSNVEGIFLEDILRFFRKELARSNLPPDHAKKWLNSRSEMLATGTLHFHAANVDILARRG